jgi:hypothetical protein
MAKGSRQTLVTMLISNRRESTAVHRQPQKHDPFRRSRMPSILACLDVGLATKLLSISQGGDHDGLDRVQPVFGLVKDDRVL